MVSLFAALLMTAAAQAGDGTAIANIVELTLDNKREEIKSYMNKSGQVHRCENADIVLQILDENERALQAAIEGFQEKNNRPAQMKLEGLLETSFPVWCGPERTKLCEIAEKEDGDKCVVLKSKIESSWQYSYGLKHPENAIGMAFLTKESLKKYLSAVKEGVSSVNVETEGKAAKDKANGDRLKKVAATCKSQGISNLVEVSVRIEKRLDDGTVMMRLNGVRRYICGSMSENAKILPKFFFVKGLSDPRQNHCGLVVIRSAGKTKVKNAAGFVEEQPIWRFVSESEQRNHSSIIDQPVKANWRYCESVPVEE